MKKKTFLTSLLALMMALMMVLSPSDGLLSLLAPAQASAMTLTAEEDHAALIAKSKKKKTTASPVSPSLTASPSPTATPSPSPAASIEEDGTYTAPQDIADYLFTYGRLPGNFLTKKEAQALGWDSRYNYVGDVAPGMSIGGDYFGNYEQKLPTAKGRKYYECDCSYTGTRRGAERIIFSNDGLVYYTADHYETFTEMKPSWE